MTAESRTPAGQEGMNLGMVRVRNLGVGALAALLATTSLPPSAMAQAAQATRPAQAPAAAQAAPAQTQPAQAQPAPGTGADLGVAEPEGIAEGVAASVNDDIITSYDLRQRMLLLIATTGVRPTEQTLPQIEREALRSLVDERLQMQELRRVEVEVEDREVDQELAALAKDANLTVEQLTQQLAAQGINISTLREQLRAEAGWRYFIRGRYGSRLRIGEDQVKAALARINAQSSKPQYLVGEILIDPNRVGGINEAVAGAQQLITQMGQGAPFTAVARQFSAAPSAASGGDAGWLSSGEVAPELEQALSQMRPGQLSQPIQTRDGVYIVLLRQKREGAGATLVNLRQVALRLPADAKEPDVQAAQKKLEGLRSQITGCADLQAKAAAVQGAVASDLGEAEVGDLAPQFRQAAETLQPNQVSAPIRTSAGLHLVAVCGKRQGGVNLPTADQVENRLFGQQLSMISRRYLRDLRSAATIESR